MHIGNHALDRIEGATQVGRKYSIPHIQSQLVHTAILQANIGGIINQNVDLAIPFSGIFDQRFDALHLHDVHEMVRSFTTLSLDGIHNTLSLGLTATTNNNRSAFGCKNLCDTGADTTGRAGNNSNFAF